MLQHSPLFLLLLSISSSNPFYSISTSSPLLTFAVALHLSLVWLQWLCLPDICQLIFRWSLLARHMTCVTKQGSRKDAWTPLFVLSLCGRSWTPLTLICCSSSPSPSSARVPAVSSCSFSTRSLHICRSSHLISCLLLSRGTLLPPVRLHVSLLLFSVFISSLCLRLCYLLTSTSFHCRLLSPSSLSSTLTSSLLIFVVTHF